MKKETEKFEPKRLFEEFMNSFVGYMRRDDIRMMFYYKAYLLYLAKKKNINLKIQCYNKYFEHIGEKGIGFENLLKDLLDIYSEYNDITKEYLILKDIKELFEKNYINEELDDKLFDEMSKLTEEELKEIFSQNSLELKNYSNKENNASQKAIVELVIKILDIQDYEVVLDLCSGSGDFLTSIAKYNTKIKLKGIEINPDNALISKIRLAVLSDNNAEIIVGDALTYDFNNKFDKIFCEYPLGIRVENFRLNQLNNNLIFKWNKTGLTSDWMFLNKILTLLKPNGTAALIITDAPLFKSMDIDCRRDILLSGFIKCIIKLPIGIFPNSNISTNLFIVSGEKNNNNEIKFIDATQEYKEDIQKGKQLDVNAIMDLINGVNNDEDKVKTKSANEICLTQDVLLTVNSYVKKNDPNYINPHILKGFIKDKYRGYQFTSKEQAEITDKNGDYELLSTGDINDGRISDNLLKINGNNNKYDRYLLQSGNIVITSKGTKIKIAVAEVGNRKIIPNGNLLVLRLDTKKINPYYLKAYLDSENGRLSLEQIQTGAISISINPNRIEQINVSMVDKDLQEAFAEKYKHKMEELFSAQEQVEKLKEEIDNLFKNEIEIKGRNL